MAWRVISSASSRSIRVASTSAASTPTAFSVPSVAAGSSAFSLPVVRVQEDNALAEVEHLRMDLLDVFGEIHLVGRESQLPLPEPLSDLRLQPEEFRLCFGVHSGE